MNNNWILRLKKHVLFKNHKTKLTNFTKLIQLPVYVPSFWLSSLDLEEIQKNINVKAKKKLFLTFGIENKLDIRITTTSDLRILMPFYLRSSKKIVLPNRLALLKDSKNIYDQEIFWFFLYHELGHAFLDQNSSHIYKTKKIKEIFVYLCNEYNLVNLKIENKILNLDIEQVYQEFLPDYIAMLLLDNSKEFNLNKNYKEFLKEVTYFKTNQEIKEIFEKDPHAPIEARLYISKKAVDCLNK